EYVRRDRDFAGQLASTENLEAVAQFLDDAEFHETVGGKAVAFQFLQPAEVHDGVLFLEDIGKAALGQTAVNGHLPAFESALLRGAGARVLALMAARGGLPPPRSHTTADALGRVFLPGGRMQLTQVHGVSPIRPPPADAVLS